MVDAGGSSIAALGAVTLLLFGGCKEASRGTIALTQRDSAGVRIVEISGELPQLDWEIRRRLQIGGREEGPESFYRVAPELVAVGPRGNIHVLDPIRRRIVSFSPEGVYLGSVGSEGDGPAEFRAPFAFALTEEGDFIVADRARNGLARLGPAGEPRSSIQVDAPIFGASRAAIAGVTPVFTMFQWTGPSAGVESLHWGSSARQLAAVHLDQPDTGPFTTCPGAWVGLPFLDRGLLWAASGQGVVVSATHEYEIRVLDRGELRVVIQRDVERQPATASAVAHHVGQMFEARTGRGTCTVPVEEAIRTKGYLEEVPAIMALARSPAGQIWVRRGSLPVADGPVAVFEGDGTPLGTLPPGAPFPIAFIPGGIVSSEEDEFGVQRLVVYDLR